MKNLSIILAAAALLAPGFAATADAAPLRVAMNSSAPKKANKAGKVVINGSGNTETIHIDLANLVNDVKLTATDGFSVYPATIAATETGADVMITLDSWLSEVTGQLILRSGDVRTYIDLQGFGSPLEVKSLSENPVLAEYQTKYTDDATKFKPGDKGYTVEYKVKTASENATFKAFAVDENGVGFQASLRGNIFGILNGDSNEISIKNPATNRENSNGGFYNDDENLHTYRFAVVPDGHIFVYRDGLAIDTLRSADYGHQIKFLGEEGRVKENLLKNPGFEMYAGPFYSGTIHELTGWTVDPIDQYNCSYDVTNREINNELDHDNHVMKLTRYNWNDGWAAGTVSQIVDVVPGETYNLTFLARGGMCGSSSNLTNMGYVKIEEVGNPKAVSQVVITNKDNFQEYSLDHNVSADCDQIKVILYQERFLNGGGWGSTCTPLEIDEMILTGASRKINAQAGINNANAKMEYFTYDLTGAYAPVEAKITTSVPSIVLDGTGKTATIKINSQEMIAENKMTVTCPDGFTVYPATLTPNEENELMVSLESSLKKVEGNIIVRCGDARLYIPVTGYGSALEEKSLAENPVHVGAGGSLLHKDEFTPGENGYTMEFKVRTDASNNSFTAHAVDAEGNGLGVFVKGNNVGVSNSINDINLSNPESSVTGGNGGFYNNDSQSHTYRYAITPDHKAYVYRDGVAIDVLDTRTYGHLKKMLGSEGRVSANLLKNPGFELPHDTVSGGTIRQVTGWILEPIDQYNCSYDVINREINNELDPDNHVMKLTRYNWNDGWGAGTVSQIVDVVPGETYNLTFLARGGMCGKSGNLENMGYVKIEEVGNPKAVSQVVITNKDNFQEYSLDHNVSADCDQIKVILYQERFLNGGGWGSTCTPLEVDEMVLTGVSRKVEKQIGYTNASANVDYFTYDATGAYAPLSTVLGNVGVDGINAFPAVKAVVRNGELVLENAPLGAAVRVVSATGMTVVSDIYKGQNFTLSGKGVYVCEISRDGERKVMRVINL